MMNIKNKVHYITLILKKKLLSSIPLIIFTTVKIYREHIFENKNQLFSKTNYQIKVSSAVKYYVRLLLKHLFMYPYDVIV